MSQTLETPKSNPLADRYFGDLIDHDYYDGTYVITE